MIDIIRKYVSSTSDTTFKEKVVNSLLKFLFEDELDIEYKNKKLIIHSPLDIHFDNTVNISSDKHIILITNQDREKNRPGYTHSVWLNPEKDNNGNPIQLMTLINEYGELWNWQMEFDEN